MKKIIIIDNYDSFTYNLVHEVEKIVGHKVDVFRNDEIPFDRLDEYEYIILSPGPGVPDEAGDLKKVIKEFGHKKKMLGVCLGHQAIGEVYGATLENLEKVYHGIQTNMSKTKEDPIFRKIHGAFPAGRYHSWVIQKGTLSEEFTVTSTDERGEIMSFAHKDYPLYGVQFHPESILTPDGPQMLANFLSL